MILMQRWIIWPSESNKKSRNGPKHKWSFNLWSCCATEAILVFYVKGARLRQMQIIHYDSYLTYNIHQESVSYILQAKFKIYTSVLLEKSLMSRISTNFLGYKNNSLFYIMSNNSVHQGTPLKMKRQFKELKKTP